MIAESMVAERMIEHVDRLLHAAGGRYPASADSGADTWTWTDDGSWNGGFWAGLLWLSAAATGEDRYASAAHAATMRLAARAGAPTLLRGDLFWYSAAAGSRLGLDHTADVAVRVAQAMADDEDPVAGVLPPGVEDAREYDWPRPGVCIDGLPGTAPLLFFAAERSGSGRLREIAESHTRGTVAMCVRPDGSTAQTATYDEDGEPVGRVAINGVTPDSTWARGHAWGMLGLAQAAARNEEFREPARRLADWWLAHVPEDRICYWDFDVTPEPGTLRDTSGTAIAAAALAKLGYREEAAATLEALAGHIGPDGGLRDGCPDRGATSRELIWGDYFLLETALILDGAIEPDTL
jgi:unsaturated chondroitin disaccharide hydrolase